MRKALVIVLAILLASVSLAQDDGPGMTYEESLACVRQILPAESYATNEFIPTEEDLENISPLDEQVHLRVGMPWILNDEESAFYNAVVLGFYAAEGLDVELVEGGPGLDHMQTLGAGAVDITVQAAGGSIPQARVSPTPINTVAIGTILKIGQYTYLTTNPELLDRELTPEDLIGRTIATQSDGEYYTHILLDQNGISRDSVEINATAGFGPDVLMTKPPQADFYTGWISNQPRALDAEGFAWNGLRHNEWSYNEYTDVIAVHEDMLATDEGREIVRRFMRATYRGLAYLVLYPNQSAEITVDFPGVELTVDQALWRFNIQEEQNLIRGNSGRLLEMDLSSWDEAVATVLQYGQLEMECK